MSMVDVAVDSSAIQSEKVRVKNAGALFRSEGSHRGRVSNAHSSIRTIINGDRQQQRLDHESRPTDTAFPNAVTPLV